MDEYITRAEFEQFKRQIEQKTEEIPAIRVDVHNVDVEAIKQEFHTVSNTWLETLQEHYDDHTKHFEKIESAMATKEDLATLKTAQDAHFDQIEAEQKEQHEMLRQILRLLGQKPPES